MSQTVPIPQHQSSPPLTRGITIHPPHQITIYNNPKTAATIPAPAPNIGNAVAFAPDSVTAPPAAEVAELAVRIAGRSSNNSAATARNTINDSASLRSAASSLRGIGGENCSARASFGLILIVRVVVEIGGSRRVDARD
jgi:hypothetical protein